MSVSCLLGAEFSLIAYYADGKKKAEAGDTLLKINASDKIAWHDTDNNGIWSAGDSLWYAAGSAVTQGVTKFDPAVDFALAGDPAEGAIGQIVATDTYGFAFVQEAAETDWVVQSPSFLPAQAPCARSQWLLWRA